MKCCAFNLNLNLRKIINDSVSCFMGLPRWLTGKESTCQYRRHGTRGDVWVQSLGQEDPLEEETATHSSILAWRIPWTEEPGRLESMGCKEPDMTQQLNYNNNNKHVLCLMHVIISCRDHNCKWHICKQQILQIFLSYERRQKI